MSHLSRKRPYHLAVDLDGTLAHYEGWKGPEHIGDPIYAVVDRVRAALHRGWKVSIFTARVAGPPHQDAGTARLALVTVQRWCLTHFGQMLEVTAVKSPTIDEMWDDRAVGIVKNAGAPRLGGDLWDQIKINADGGEGD